MMSLTAKIAGLALVTASLSFIASPSLAQNVASGTPDSVYRNGPIKQGDRCWVTFDATRVYGFWRACPAQAQKPAAAPAQNVASGTRDGIYRNGAIKSGDRCWVSVDATRVYGYWRTCPTQAQNVAAKRNRRG
jgi:hypothetical protein